MKRGLAVLLFATLLAACQEEPAPAPQTSEMTIGVHRISMVLPEGWEHLDHGLEHLFRRDFALIGIQDLGLRQAPEDGGPTIEERIDVEMGRLGFNSQRDIASRKTRNVQGRDLIVIDTWDRLTHDHKRRFAFCINEGNVLVIYTKQGKWEVTRPALEQMIDSLAFVETESTSGETTE